jgi:hypothetical protein
MFKRSHEKRKFKPAQVADGIPHALAHGAEEAVERVSGAVETAGARVAKSAKSARRHPPGDVLLKAELAKTSRELAHESSNLHAAVDSLNAIVRANRKAPGRGRVRLLCGLAIGAALMYHLDPEHGRARRAETARGLTRLTGGQPAEQQAEN